jgi:undecaprenyl-diphosphatase
VTVQVASITSVDQHVLRWIVGHRVGPLNPVFKTITYGAVGGTIWVAAAAVLAWRTHRPIVPISVFAGSVVWGADGLANLLKAITNRPRPYAVMPHLHVLIARPSSGSFPSQHATTTFAGATLLSFLWPKGSPVFLFAAVVIGFSRLYLGVHYPTDVLAGAAIGAAVAGIGILVVTKTRLRERLLRAPGEGTRWF